MKKVLKFTLWTLGISYLYVIIYYYGLNIRSGSLLLPLNIIYMWIPALVAILLTKKEGKSIRDMGIYFKPNRWFFIAVILFITITFITIPINTVFPGVSFSFTMEGYFDKYSDLLTSEQLNQMQDQVSNHPWRVLLISILQAIGAAFTINAVAAFGEELGWRGYLYKALENQGFWKMSALVGLIWGIWHAPIILQGHNYGEFNVIGVFMMILFCILISPLFTLIRFKSRSVIGAAVAHGAINAIAGIGLIYIKGGNSLINGLTGLSGFIVLSMINIILWSYTKKDSDLRNLRTNN